MPTDSLRNAAEGHGRSIKQGRALRIIEDQKGRRGGDIRKGSSRAEALAVKLAAKRGIEIDLSGVTPDTLKHTAITWAMQKGATPWDAASLFLTSIEAIKRDPPEKETKFSL